MDVAKCKEAETVYKDSVVYAVKTLGALPKYVKIAPLFHRSEERILPLSPYGLTFLSLVEYTLTRKP